MLRCDGTSASCLLTSGVRMPAMLLRASVDGKILVYSAQYLHPLRDVSPSATLIRCPWKHCFQNCLACHSLPLLFHTFLEMSRQLLNQLRNAIGAFSPLPLSAAASRYGSLEIRVLIKCSVPLAFFVDELLSSTIQYTDAICCVSRTPLP